MGVKKQKTQSFIDRDWDFNLGGAVRGDKYNQNTLYKTLEELVKLQNESKVSLSGKVAKPQA